MTGPRDWVSHKNSERKFIDAKGRPPTTNKQSEQLPDTTDSSFFDVRKTSAKDAVSTASKLVQSHKST